MNAKQAFLPGESLGRLFLKAQAALEASVDDRSCSNGLAGAICDFVRASAACASDRATTRADRGFGALLSGEQYVKLEDDHDSGRARPFCRPPLSVSVAPLRPYSPRCGHCWGI
jgi:hypothetical protein